MAVTETLVGRETFAGFVPFVFSINSAKICSPLLTVLRT